MINKPLQLNAVIGFPLKHTLSPLLHNALYRKLGLNAKMVTFAGKDAKALVLAIRRLNIALTAVTMPHKQTVMKYLDRIDCRAKKLGAVNTIINTKGKLTGYNTDLDGISHALKGVFIKNKRVLILGAGGAARSVAFYLKSRKGKIFYANRTKSKAVRLKKEFGGEIVGNNDLKNFDIIINATPIGMYPDTNASPFDKKFLRKGQTVFDLVYNPIQTRFIEEAKYAGARTILGLEMFVEQAVKQIELFGGKKIGKDVREFAKKLLAEKLRNRTTSFAKVYKNFTKRI